VLLSNRAAVSLQRQQWEAAARDASAAVSANPRNPKAHLRYATALRRSGRPKAAADALRAGLVAGSRSPADAAALQGELDKLQAQTTGSGSSNGAPKGSGGGGFLNNRTAAAKAGGLFGTNQRDGAAPLPPASEADRLLQRLKAALQLPGGPGGGGGGGALDGVFSKLQVHPHPPILPHPSPSRRRSKIKKRNNSK
jgi:hypothetical protein